ncbi:hypothetical protein [Paraburkholderia bryophila]|uniref:Uncharacterized protein n=1 Tax=Paraburkholderia bryophila TaxID=420952 RepID=A0A7Y9WJ03_9BURK|nr:hypothetical protein [Paraburkholderia bryophila]NYH21747.1 hypothetical protein [Paraburkholderia bryophila]
MPRVTRRGPFNWELPDQGFDGLHYAGSVPVGAQDMRRATDNAQARLEAAKAGGFRRFERTEAVQWTKDVKGCLAEAIGVPLADIVAMDRREPFASTAPVADQPIRDVDVTIGCRRFDIKASCDRLPGIQERNDRYFAVNADQLSRYESLGYDGLMFVRIVKEGKLADVWFVSLQEVRRAKRHPAVTENVSDWYAVTIPRTTDA